MAETHILQHAIAFALAVWWTKGWLMNRLVSRWRFALSGFAGALLWLYVAFTATRVFEYSGGQEVVYSSLALAYLAGFMVFLSLVGTVLGLFLWTEEEGQRAVDELGDGIRTRFDPPSD